MTPYAQEIEQLFERNIFFPSTVIVAPRRNLPEIRDAYSAQLDERLVDLQQTKPIGYFLRDVPLIFSEWLLNAKPKLLDLRKEISFDTPYLGLGPAEYYYLVALRLAALTNARLARFRYHSKEGLAELSLVKTYALFDAPVESFVDRRNGLVATHYETPFVAQRIEELTIGTTQPVDIKYSTFKLERVAASITLSDLFTSASFHKELEAMSQNMRISMGIEFHKTYKQESRLANQLIGRLFELLRNFERVNQVILPREQMLYLLPESLRSQIFEDKQATLWLKKGSFFNIRMLFERNVDELVLIRKDDYHKLFTQNDDELRKAR